MKSVYNMDAGISSALGISRCVEEAGNYSDFLRISRELNHFLQNLNYSNNANGTGQRVHYLFLALDNLDKVEKEIRISGAQEDAAGPARVIDKIRDLKILMLDYIRHLTGEI